MLSWWFWLDVVNLVVFVGVIHSALSWCSWTCFICWPWNFWIPWLPVFLSLLTKVVTCLSPGIAVESFVCPCLSPFYITCWRLSCSTGCASCGLVSDLALVFLHSVTSCPYWWQNLHNVGLQSYITFCSIRFPHSFLNIIESGSLVSIPTSTRSLAKFKPTFIYVFWSTIKGFPIRLPNLLKPFGLQYLKSRPGSLIHIGTVYTSSLVNSISGFQALTINGLLSKWNMFPCNTSFFP